jgi:23S rRNA-/tRNA-specific pseudouridylate synthase
VVRSGGDPSSLAVVAAAPAPGRTGEWHALIKLETGRFHQIRAMLSNRGFPLVGDRDYGGAPGAMYLDHASLWFPSIDGGRMQRAWLAEDRGREALDPAISVALHDCVA